MDSLPLWRLDSELCVGVTCATCRARRIERIGLLCSEGRMGNLQVEGLTRALRCANRRCGGPVAVILARQ